MVGAVLKVLMLGYKKTTGVDAREVFVNTLDGAGLKLLEEQLGIKVHLSRQVEAGRYYLGGENLVEDMRGRFGIEEDPAEQGLMWGGQS